MLVSAIVCKYQAGHGSLDHGRQRPVRYRPNVCHAAQSETRARLNTKGHNPLSGTVVGQSDETYSRYGSRQTLISPSGSVLCLMKMAHAGFLSDTTQSPMVTSRSVFGTTTALDSEPGS